MALRFMCYRSHRESKLGNHVFVQLLIKCSLDDTSLERSVSALPKNSILLLEDIDCAFPSREEEDELPNTQPFLNMNRRTNVTVSMSALLNVIDGVGSEDGKIVFATVSDVCLIYSFS